LKNFPKNSNTCNRQYIFGFQTNVQISQTHVVFCSCHLYDNWRIRSLCTTRSSKWNIRNSSNVIYITLYYTYFGAHFGIYTGYLQTTQLYLIVVRSHSFCPSGDLNNVNLSTRDYNKNDKNARSVRIPLHRIYVTLHKYGVLRILI